MQHVTFPLRCDWLNGLSVTLLGGGVEQELVAAEAAVGASDRHVFGSRREKAGPEPERTAHGPGERCLPQPLQPGRAAVGPRQRGNTLNTGLSDSERP